MKIMNVGNANYANSRQQNFGMKINATEDAINLIGKRNFSEIVKKLSLAKYYQNEPSADIRLSLDRKGLIVDACDNRLISATINGITVVEGKGGSTIDGSGFRGLSGKLQNTLLRLNSALRADLL